MSFELLPLSTSSSLFLFFFLTSLGGAEHSFCYLPPRKEILDYHTYSHASPKKASAMQYSEGVLIRYLACVGLPGRDTGVVVLKY